MVELGVIFFLSLGIGLTGAIMPGPLLALTVKESLGRGKVAALWLSGGHSFCELVVVGALVGGLSRLVSADTIAGPAGLVGGAVLLWMGIGAFRETRRKPDRGEESAPSAAGHNLVAGGAAVTVSNPYWIIWWLTIGLALVSKAAEAGAAGIAVFYVGHISADFLWFGLVGFLVGWRGRMLSESIYRRALQACGVFLFVFGLSFVGYGGQLIRSSLVP